MKRILGVLLAGVLLLSGCGQWQKSQKESAYHLYCLDKTGTTPVSYTHLDVYKRQSFQLSAR